MIWLCVLFRIEYEKTTVFFHLLKLLITVMFTEVIYYQSIEVICMAICWSLTLNQYFGRTNSQLKSIDENLIGNPVSSSMPKLLHWPNSKRMCIDLKRSNESPCAHNEHEKHRENVWKREIANILSNGGYLGFLLAYRLFVDSVSIYFVHTKRLSNDIKSKTIETIKK